MSTKNISFDEVWERRYGNPGYRNHYPWSSVVTFVFRNRPRDRAPAETRVLEVGCGNGSNLWFAAREGFRTAGIDGSETAIAYARDWFQREGLSADFHVGNFAKLPFPNESFDLVIDRAALSFANAPTVTAAVQEICRVMRRGGRFMFTPYSDHCTSFDGLPDDDGCYRGVTHGSINPGAQVRFYGLNEVRSLLQVGWTIRELDHIEDADFLNADRRVHAEWHVIAEKT